MNGLEFANFLSQAVSFFSAFWTIAASFLDYWTIAEVIFATVLAILVYALSALKAVEFDLNCVVIILAFVLLVVDYGFMSYPSGHKVWSIIFVFYSSIVAFIIVFHIIAVHGGFYISAFFQRHPRLKVPARNWPKLIDYIYLVTSATGIITVVVTPSSLEQMTRLKAVYAITLGIVLALRMTKTSIETFDLGTSKMPEPTKAVVALDGLTKPRKH